MSYLQLLSLLGPETILALGALAILLVDLVVMNGQAVRLRLAMGATLVLVTCLGALFWMCNAESHANLFNGMLVVDALTRFVKGALLVLAIFTALISVDSTLEENVGEYFALILMATLGMMFMVGSEEILMIFVALELTSLSLYILTAYNKRSPESAEAALKYFLFGGMSAAFTLFGLSLLYGLSGATNLAQIAAALKEQGNDPLLAVALVMTVIGFGFKIAAVPFHLWAPDAYQGAPTPSSAFIASGSKVASFFIFAKVMMFGFAGVEGSGAWRAYLPGWVPVLAILAAFSMVLGNVVAIVQSNVKRLLAYSAIAHAGYMLLGMIAHDARGIAALIYYVTTYGLATVGAFGVISVAESHGVGVQVKDLAGFCKRAPVLSLCLMIFILSLAGIPPLAGFFGKFFLFLAAAGAGKSLGLLWLVILAIGMSAVSLYYYLIVLKQVYVVPGGKTTEPIRPNVMTSAAISFLALAVLVLGCAPNLLLGPLGRAISAAGLK